MQDKLKVGIIFGGKSAEHEVSLQSAKNVYDAIDKDRFEPLLIGINKKGKWLLSQSSNFLLNSQNPKLIKLNDSNKNVALIPASEGNISNLSSPSSKDSIDVAFPILHGPHGEDGTVQGLLKLAGIPFVGAGVLGSAVGMDKDVMKRLLRDANIPIGKFKTFKRQNVPSYDSVFSYLGTPIFIKPSNMGSSVGVSKVESKQEYEFALEEAFGYDTKVIAEEYIVGREIECSVLGNDEPIASVPGEVIPNHDFYSYEAKYIDENGAALEIPANISEEEKKDIQDLAVATFRALSCEGMGRVDCFLGEGGKVTINEINTIPGFTAISMYPKLWEASGLPYTELITRLIELAIERFNKEKILKSSYK